MRFLIPADWLKSLKRWIGKGWKLKPVHRDHCPYCDEFVEIGVVRKEETFPVKDVPISVMANVAVCVKCGKEIFNEVLDEETLEKAYRKYNETASKEDLIVIPED